MFSYYEPYLLLQIYRKIISKQAILENYPTQHQQFSAANLTAFTELHKNINISLLDFLKAHGLCLTHTDEILKGLHQTCVNLGMGAYLPPVNFQSSNDALKRKYSILQSNRSDRPEIMVTLDIHYSEEFIMDLLKNGMTIARINCAYGTQEEWEKLIYTIRNAEKKMQANSLEYLPCKIYMDLAGPKVRVGPILKITYPFKIKVNKDRYGFPVRKKTGLLQTKKDVPIQRKDAFDFILPLDINKDITFLKVGDVLQFTDYQNRKREFLIIDTHPNGYITSIDKTTYIAEGTPLMHEQSNNEIFVDSLKSSAMDIFVKSGDRLIINLSDSVKGKAATSKNPAIISTTLPDAFYHVKIGDEIYIDDGKIQGVVEQINPDSILVNIVYPNVSEKIKECKGINLPNTKIELPFLTEKDLHDLSFISTHADLLGVSFINRADDLTYLQAILPEKRLANLTIVAKIETIEAIRNFSEILLKGLHFPKFAVMVARGDLAIEVGFEKLPIIQREMHNMCQAAHVPIILATQILDRLAKTGLPSRSELADVLIGSSFDCMMLNKGPYADKAVDFLKETLQLIVETHQYEHKHVRRL